MSQNGKEKKPKTKGRSGPLEKLFPPAQEPVADDHSANGS